MKLVVTMFIVAFLVGHAMPTSAQFVKGNQAVWGAATYHDRYVRESGVWKFQHVRVESHFWTSFEEGWARMRFMQRRNATE